MDKTPLSKIMSIDYGLKKIGVALTDMMQITANPFAVIESVCVKDNAKKLSQMAKENSVSEIVVGLPINMSGSQGAMAKTVRIFIEELKKVSNLPVVEIDETLSTVEALEIINTKAKRIKNRKKDFKDKIAAALILQRYLEKKCFI